MEKIKDLAHVLHENYNKEEYEEYLKRKILLLQKKGIQEEIIQEYIQRLYSFEQSEKESNKQR